MVQPPKVKSLTLGSKFCYSGCTQVQTCQASPLTDRPAAHFECTLVNRFPGVWIELHLVLWTRVLGKIFLDLLEMSQQAYGHGVVSAAIVRVRDGRRDIRSPTKAPHVQLIGAKCPHESLNVVEEKKQAEIGEDKSVITEDMNGEELSPGGGPGEPHEVEPLTQKDSTSLCCESKEAGVGEPHHHGNEDAIKEEQEEDKEVQGEPQGRNQCQKPAQADKQGLLGETES